MKLKMPTCNQVGHWFTDPVHRTRGYFRELVAAFGWRFVVMVVFGEHLLKGFLNGGGAGGFFTIEDRCYMSMGIGSADRQSIEAMSGSPWALKPIMGMISDSVIIRQKRRVQWIVVTSVLAVASYAVILAMQKSAPYTLLAICFFFGRLQCAWTDLMIESCYAEKIKRVPEHASDIITWVWVGIGAGGFIAFLIVGVCLNTIGPFLSAAIPLALCGLPIIPACLGWMEEEPCTTPSCGIRWEVLNGQRPYFIAGFVLFAAVVVGIGCSMSMLSQMGQCIQALVCAAGVFAVAIYCLPKALWGPMLYMFLANALAIQTYSFVNNFYLDPATEEESQALGYPICYDCPHFDNYFYTTVVGVVDMLCTSIGSWMFNAWISRWKYRKALIITQIILMLSSLCDVVQFQRWNRDIGIPDWVFMLGKSALQNTCSMLNFMPNTILVSKLCPAGLESTIYALLAGYSNYGSTVSNYVGAYVIQWIGLGNIGSGRVDDFSNAWIACVINACFPLLVLLTLPWLIPDAYMTDSLDKLAKEADFTKDKENDSSQLENIEDHDMMDMELEVGDDAAMDALAPAPTPLLGLAERELSPVVDEEAVAAEIC